jgi:hypothetical protein
MTDNARPVNGNEQTQGTEQTPVSSPATPETNTQETERTETETLEKETPSTETSEK